MKNQLSFNKMIETQLSQPAASLPSSETGGILGQPEPTRDNLKSVTTRGGKTTQDPPHPNPAEKKQKEVTSKSDEEVYTKEASRKVKENGTPRICRHHVPSISSKDQEAHRG
jgi:hypothetical protein